MHQKRQSAGGEKTVESKGVPTIMMIKLRESSNIVNWNLTIVLNLKIVNNGREQKMIQSGIYLRHRLPKHQENLTWFFLLLFPFIFGGGMIFLATLYRANISFKKRSC